MDPFPGFRDMAPSAAAASAARPHARQTTRQQHNSFRGHIAAVGGPSAVLTIVPEQQLASHMSNASHIPLLGKKGDAKGFLNMDHEQVLHIAYVAPEIVAMSLMSQEQERLEQGGVMIIDLSVPDLTEPLSEGLMRDLRSYQEESGQGLNVRRKAAVRVAGSIPACCVCPIQLGGHSRQLSQSHPHLFAAAENLDSVDDGKFRVAFYDADTPSKGPLHVTPGRAKGMVFEMRCLQWIGGLVVARGPGTMDLCDPEEFAMVCFNVETGKQVSGLKLTGHSSTVFSLAVDEMRRSVFSGQALAEKSPACVKVWDLSAGSSGSLVTTIPHANHVVAIHVDAAMNELVTLAGRGTVRVFDTRKLDELVRSFPLMDEKKMTASLGSAARRRTGPESLMFGSIEKLSSTKFVSCLGSIIDEPTPGAPGLVTWNANGKIFQRAAEIQTTALCVLRGNFEGFYVMPADEIVGDEQKSRMRVLLEKKETLFDFVIKSARDPWSGFGGEVRCPKAFIPNVADELKELVLPDGPIVDPDLVLELLFGTVTAIRVDQISPSFAFFSQLGMKLHQLMMCKHAQSMQSLRDQLAVLGTSRNSERSRGMSTASPLEHACLNTLTVRLGEITADPTLLEIATRLNVLELIKAHIVSPVREHKDFGLKKEDAIPGSWESLASRTFSEAWKSKKFPSLKLKTSDAAVIPTYLPILCCRTNWMAKILEFGGKEVESLHESGEVAVDLSFSALMALLRFVHCGPEAVKSRNLSALLAVLDHATRYNELGTRLFFIGRIKEVSAGLGKGRDFSHAIAPVAHLLRNMEAFREVQKYWVDADLIAVAALDALIADGERNEVLAASSVRMEGFEAELGGVKQRVGRLEASVEKLSSQIEELKALFASFKGD